MMMDLSSAVAVAVAAATASIRPISARRTTAAAASHSSSVKESAAGAAFCSVCEATDDCWEVMLLKLRYVGFVGVRAGAGAGFLGVALKWVAATSQLATLMITSVEFSKARSFTLSSAASDRK